MIKLKNIFLASVIFLSVLPIYSQHDNNLLMAEQYYNSFIRYFSEGAEDAAYTSLYKSYEAYKDELNNTENVTKAKVALKDIYQYLQNAAYYYSSKNNQQRTLQYAQAYIGLSMMPEMQDMYLSRTENYAILAKLAAFNTWNRREYIRSIPYFHAYISTGENDRREDAYACLGKAYYSKKDYTHANQILEEALLQYPNNLSLLSTMINTCLDTGDDDKLQKYLKKALVLKPADEGLLNTQGLLYEKQQKYEEAIPIYQKIKIGKPNSLDVARHLALDYYNAGVQYLNRSKEKPNMSQYYVRKSEDMFRQAIPILNDILAADPLSVKYACALATAYSCIGEDTQLQAMNNKIEALGISPISGGNTPEMITLDGPAPSLAARQTTQQQKTVISAPKEEPIIVADVDKDIPVTKNVNSNTYAVIIANEEYKHLAKVPMASNDGRIFSEYCSKILGLPKDNIRTYFDATGLDMEEAVEDIKKIAKVCQGQLNVIFYYAGHGIPDDATKDAYLLPVDGRENSVTGCMKLEDLYKNLGGLNARCVTVFLDACFSGAMRDGSMLVAARGVAYKPKPQNAYGNMVVFAATADNQTALAYKEKQHGMFTYYLLKKLKESRGNVTLEDLGDYLIDNVSLQSQLKNRKEQTPTIMTAPEFADKWKSLKLIK